MANNKRGFVRRLWHEDSLNQRIVFIRLKDICRFISNEEKKKEHSTLGYEGTVGMGMVLLSTDKKCISLTTNN